MHPLTNSLAEISDKELGDKIFDIQKRLSVAYRLGKGDLVVQLQMILEDYSFEHQKRMEKQMQELLSKNDKQMRDLIDIK